MDETVCFDCVVVSSLLVRYGPEPGVAVRGSGVGAVFLGLARGGSADTAKEVPGVIFVPAGLPPRETGDRAGGARDEGCVMAVSCVANADDWPDAIKDRPSELVG